MAELILHSQLIKPLCDFMRAELALYADEPFVGQVYVGRRVPDPRRDRMIIFANRGGFKVNPVWLRSTVDMSVWGKDDPGADDLAQLAAAIMASANDSLIESAEVITYPQDVADASGQPLRFVRLSVTHRALPGA